MKNTIYSLLFLLIFCGFASIDGSKRDFFYYQQSLVEEFLALIDAQSSHDSPHHPSSARKVPEINIDLWNQLNDEEMKQMPEIEDYSDENTARAWLEWFFRISKRYHQISAVLSWNYDVNITKENEEIKSKQSLRRAPFSKLTVPIAKKFHSHMKNSDDEDLQRIFRRLALGTVQHNDEELKRGMEIQDQMVSIYSKTEVCEANDPKKCYQLAPYLERLMQTEKDYDRLVWAWKGWHDNCGNAIRPLYLQHVDLHNKNCRENGYKDLSELWIADYEMGSAEKFELIVDELLNEIMPLYKELHGYVRGRLCELYPNRFDCHGPIPAHILGNMWAQQWHDRFTDLVPYPDAPLINLTQVLNEQGYNIHRLYTTAEEFFTSIDLYPMTKKFWEKSLFVKPKDRNAVCHPAASDFKNTDDFRVRICTEVNDDYFYTIHHEMGHVEYYMSYDKVQPYVYQSGANSGFHEAIGDTIGMFAISPNHQIELGLLSADRLNAHYEINYLLRIALQKVAFIPFGYAIDKYRFGLFRGEIDREHELNSMWWAMRIEYGGVMAATHRSDATNFDPGAKYHVPGGTPYFRYFISHFLQFQFYRSLCRLKRHKGHLYLCDIYRHKDVGAKFKEMLAMGNSKDWEEVLAALDGEKRLRADAMLEYFEPLYQWLKKENRRRGYSVGWM